MTLEIIDNTKTTHKIMIEIAQACPYAGCSPLKIYQIWTAKEVFEEVNDGAAVIKVPIAKTNAALSPIALPIDKIAAFKIPSKEFGIIILKIVWKLEAPKAKEPWINEGLIALIDSSTVLTISLKT